MKKKIIIEGMSCGHCTNHVKNSLLEIDGVKGVLVDLNEKTAVVELTQAVSDLQLKATIEEAGYDVISIEAQ